jgi:hypothetical protein
LEPQQQQSLAADFRGSKRSLRQQQEKMLAALAQQAMSQLPRASQPARDYLATAAATQQAVSRLIPVQSRFSALLRMQQLHREGTDQDAGAGETSSHDGELAAAKQASAEAQREVSKQKVALYHAACALIEWLVATGRLLPEAAERLQPQAPPGVTANAGSSTSGKQQRVRRNNAAHDSHT